MSKRINFCGLIVLSAVICFLPSTGWAADMTCVTPSDLQTTVNAAAAGAIISVTGPCSGNLRITTNDITLIASGSGTPSITASDPTMDVIFVSARNVTINGFTITGGANGVHVTDLASANIVYNTIQNNTNSHTTGAGVLVDQTSVGHIGYIPGNPDTFGSNTFSGNDYDVSVAGASTATIQGNLFNGAVADDVLVAGDSHANLAGNTLNGPAKNLILIKGFAGVTLADPTADSPFSDSNTTTTRPSMWGVNCTIGGYADGQIGSILGKKKSYDAFTTSGACVDSLTGSHM